MTRKSSTRCAALALAAFATASQAAPPPREPILQMGARVADWQLARLDGAHLTHMKQESADPRSWEQGAFWAGLARFADASQQPRFRQAILDMGRANRWKLGPRRYNADDQVIGQAYLWAARHGAGAEALASMRADFDAILANPPVVHLSFVVPATGYADTACLQRWCWCDALFMAPPAWIALSRQTGDPRYARFALEEFRATTDFLYDPAERLYFRDSRFFDRRDDKGRKLFWSRGNGWVFAGLANMLDALPAGDPRRPRLEHLFRDMAGRLAGLQKPDGYWPPSLLAPEDSPPETSGTGFFVYGLAWGVEHHLLAASRYRATLEKGWAALARAVAEDGRLGWVQQVSDRPDEVAAADTQLYGVGAFLLAASAMASLAE